MYNPYLPAALLPADPGSPPTRRRYCIFVLAATASFLLYLHRYTWNLVRPQLQAEYELSNTKLEALGSAFFFPYAAAQVPGGILCDLFGPHLFLVAIIIVWSICLPLYGWAGSFTALLAVRGGFGLAQAGCYPALSQVTRAWFPVRSRTSVQGWIASGFGRGGGAMASIVMGTLLMGYFGLSWQAALVVLSVVGILFAVVFLVMFRNSPAQDPRVNEAERALIAADTPADSSERKVLPFGTALANRSFRMLLVQTFLVTGADVMFVLLLGSYLHSLGAAENGWLGLGVLISLPLWGGAIGGICGGFINDWAIYSVGSRRWARSLVASTGLGVGGATVLLAVTSQNPVTVALVLMAARFFADWSQPSFWGAATDLGAQYSATVFGFGNMLGNLGAFTVPLLVGPLLDLYTTTVVIDGTTVQQTDFAVAFAVCGLMKLTAAASWLFVDCSKPLVEAEGGERPAK